MAVFVLDRHKKPLMPCTEKRARKMLEAGRAVIHRMYPFTIRLKDRTVEGSSLQPLRLKIDPGSKDTGLAVIREKSQEEGAVIWLCNLHHKAGIKDKLDSRRAIRRSRRNRKTRYRAPRFLNRHNEKCRACGKNAQHGKHYCRQCNEAKNFVDNGHRNIWLPPSLNARVMQTINTVNKLRRLMPIGALSMELVRFDIQQMENPDISGVEYQQGDLLGYEVKEYLLTKHNYSCAYCGAKDTVLEVEHVVPRNPKFGPKGTNRLGNLVIACRECNMAKGNLQPQEWLEILKKSRSEKNQTRAKNLANILKVVKRPLPDPAMMNATRWKLFELLKSTGLPLECGSGGRTKKQRIDHGLPKASPDKKEVYHYYDACCVGTSTPDRLDFKTSYAEMWSAIGRGTRQMGKPNEYGFTCKDRNKEGLLMKHRQRRKRYFGFQTGDIVRVVKPKGKDAGEHIGRVTVRASGSFDIRNHKGEVVCHSANYKYCKLIMRGDGYGYGKTLRG